MITFGLTGGIGCGKSTVAKFFNSYDIPTVDADLVARQVVELGTEGLRGIVQLFGEEILQPDGTLDRAKLGELVFSDRGIRNVLDAWMLPLIQTESARQLEKLQQAGHTLVGYDSALILEAGRGDQFRPLVVVSCPTETQIQRLLKRNGLTADQAMRRIEAQMPTSKKVQLADFVIDTSGQLEETEKQVLSVIEQMKQLV